MKEKPSEYLETKRITTGKLGSNPSYGNNGAFKIWFQGREWLVTISSGMDWDHVSVSNPKITPSWDVMCHFKNLFFEDDETVIQYHPSKDNYVNNHQHCLHLWRPQNEEIPKPPKIFVGI